MVALDKKSEAHQTPQDRSTDTHGNPYTVVEEALRSFTQVEVTVPQHRKYSVTSESPFLLSH